MLVSSESSFRGKGLEHVHKSTSYLTKLTKVGIIKTKNLNLFSQLKKGMALLSVLENFKVDIEFSNS